MNLQQISLKILSATLAAALCITPELWAQNSQSPSQSPAAQQPETAQQPQPTPGSSTAPAATQTTPANPQPAAPANQGQTQQSPAASGTTVNPSQGPLQPVTTYPDASGAQQTQEPADVNGTQTTTTAPEAPQPKQQPSQPVGAATAERVPTAGGAAAKPAGAAIAPAKQHQTRSLLIKIGAIAAAGAALGTVYGLSRSSPSKPPGSAGIPPR